MNMNHTAPSGRKEAAVLNYLEHERGITSMLAFKHLRVTRLAAIIFNLKKKGYPIKGKMVYTTDADGNPTRFKFYWLEAEKSA